MSPELYNLLIGILQAKLKEESNAKERILEMLFSPNEDSAALAWVLIEGMDLDLDVDLELFMKNLENSTCRYYVYKNADNKSFFKFPAHVLQDEYWNLHLWDIVQLSPCIKYWKNLFELTISMDIFMYFWKKERKYEMGKLRFLPDEIGALTNLSYFQITRMPLQILPDTFVRLKKMRKIVITHTELSELPKGIGQLKNLKILILSDNQFTTLPEELSELKQLQAFEIKNNPLELDLIPEILFDEQRSSKAVARALKKII